MQETRLEAMSEDQVLEFAGACAETARRADVDLLRAAYQWALAHAADRLDPAIAARPGRERPRQWGGEGTPEVGEFATAELGVRIGRSPYAASRLIADALDLHHRHPQLWARVRAGEVRASYARHVCARTRDLTREQAAYVDAAVAESADGRIPWSRFEALVDAKVAQADPETAQAHEERAAKARFAKKLRGEAHGVASLLVRADIAAVTALDAAIAAFANRLSDSVPEATDDERRVLAVLLLVCGRSGLEGAEIPSVEQVPDVADLLPEVVLYVHTYADDDREGVARAEATARPPTRGCAACSDRRPGSGSSRCSTWPARPRSTPTRSRTDIDRPCI